MIMLSYLQGNAVIAFIIIATSVHVPNYTIELVHVDNTMACLCLKPMALIQRELSVQRSLKSNIQPELRPRLRKLVNL